MTKPTKWCKCKLSEQVKQDRQTVMKKLFIAGT